MKLLWHISLLCFLTPALTFAAKKNMEGFIRFHIEWKQHGVSLKPRSFLAPVGARPKTGTTEVRDSIGSLGPLLELKDGLLPLRAGDSAALYLVLENEGNKDVSFSVAPHETIPPASALGFQFQCLCNGAIYKVPPGKFWVRVLSLRTNREAAAQDVILRHLIFKP